VPPQPVRVLVLYSHPLMGEGLGRMLAAEPGVMVDAVDIAEAGAVEAALAREPAVIVVEEGGAIDAADIVRRSSCAVVLDVDITTTRAWALRRESLSSRPDDFLNEIRSIVNGVTRDDRGPDPDVRAESERRPGTERALRPVIVPG
jgi:DNA-binding NarL/FixJ family response regulator